MEKIKKILTTICIALSLYSFSQPTVNVWRVTPDTVCAGDSVKIDYKAIWPTQPDNTTNNFYMNPGTYIIWSGNWSILKSRPKEHYSALAAGDSTYWIKVKIPLGTTVGSHTVYTNNTGVPPIYVKNCSCTITANFTYTIGTNGSVTFSSTSVGTNTNTTYSWAFYGGAGSPGNSITTNTYISNSTFNVGLTVTNPTCSDQITIPVTVNTVGSGTTSTVGITEYELNASIPIYFDAYGKITEPVIGSFLIEQRVIDGKIYRRKIIIKE